jgi:ribose transport system permease protein
MVGVLAGLVVAAQAAYPGFLETGNVRNLLIQNTPTGLVAIAMTFVIIGGGFDLSVGSMFAIGAVVSARLALNWPVPLAVGGALLAGLIGGLANGILITRIRLNPFVVTLATTSVFSGTAYVLSNSEPVVPSVPDFGYLGSHVVLGVPLCVIILVGMFVIGGAVLSRSVFGRSVYAVGGNYEAARLAGLRVDVIRASTYVLTAVCAALAGAILASETFTGSATLGSSVALDSIAMVIVGGTSLLGGEGRMWRTGVGILIFATIGNLFDSLAVNSSVQLLIKGLIVLVAVGLDSLARRTRA